MNFTFYQQGGSTEYFISLYDLVEFLTVGLKWLILRIRDIFSKYPDVNIIYVRRVSRIGFLR